ncbi:MULTISPECIES: oxygenase MpaB family protein [Thermomonosporaceae]|uniref:oxygenase MpaB family protein n=1 Tax=Thermomonosporaceae TaxID=2012 RepID=UPI00255B20F4|nr:MULTISPECIES: oxygenase MpaB family protein [Thermomonosporaceae]MDL4772905.1 oxygenase MpaB family protein [Actinomadura xylanilytica]
MTEGLFQDDDLIRVISREGALIAAGGVASLLQTAHPKVAQGVYDHSYTADDPLRRLQNTMGWLYTVQFGTREEAERFSALVRKGHEKVTGPGYEANDPELQVWVASTLFAVAVQFYQLLFRREFDARELADFYRQAKIYATILGCPEDRMPATYPEFRAYYAEMIATIQITDASRAIAEQVLNPRLPFGFAAAPGLMMIRLITVGLMPEPIRVQYGWTWDARRRRRFDRLVRTLAVVYPRLPAPVRTLPRTYYLRTTRRMLAKVAEQRRPVISVKSDGAEEGPAA